MTVIILLAGLLAATSPRQLPEHLPVSALPLRLVGIVADQGMPWRSACLIECSYQEGTTGRFRIGDQACGLAEIVDVRRDTVVITNLLTRRLELVVFPSEGPQAEAPVALPPAPVVSASPGLVVVDVADASVRHYLGNLSDLLTSARATPRYREGPDGQRAIDGFEIGQVATGGPVEQLGLRDGDVVVEVNGRPLDGLAAVIKLAAETQAASHTTMTVLRKGERVTFTFNRK